MPPPAPVAGGEGPWSSLVTALAAAEAELKRVERAMAGLPFAQAEARQGEYDQAGDRFEAALKRLLRAPAPDAAAFARKILLATDHDPDGLFGGAACRKALRRDARRFSVKVVL